MFVSFCLEQALIFLSARVLLFCGRSKHRIKSLFRVGLRLQSSVSHRYSIGRRCARVCLNGLVACGLLVLRKIYTNDPYLNNFFTKCSIPNGSRHAAAKVSPSTNQHHVFDHYLCCLSGWLVAALMRVLFCPPLLTNRFLRHISC